MIEPHVGDRVLTCSGRLGTVVDRSTRLGVPVAVVWAPGWRKIRWYYLADLEVLRCLSLVT